MRGYHVHQHLFAHGSHTSPGSSLSHVHRALVPEIKKVSTFNKDVAKSLTQDIEDLQWACNDQNFQQLVKLLEEKYLNNGNNIQIWHKIT